MKVLYIRIYHHQHSQYSEGIEHHFIRTTRIRGIDTKGQCLFLPDQAGAGKKDYIFCFSIIDHRSSRTLIESSILFDNIPGRFGCARCASYEW